MKGTMLGTGGMGLAPPPASAATAPKAGLQPPPPAAAAGAAPGVAPLATTEPAPPLIGARPAPAEPVTYAAPTPQAREPQGKVDVAGTEAGGIREDSQRFLVGDPMAPAQPAQSAQRGRRFTDPDDPRVPVQRTGVLLAIGFIGMLAIAAVGYATARFMGLIH
jgi:hypothetical protein